MTKQGRIFRVFVSSTFSDLKKERNALHKYVFPRLRELCLKKGCRFQAIDLRWGIPEEAGLDQQTMRICFDEIARCRKVSPRPNFIVLLGERYGWCPLPYEIPCDEYDKILLKVTDLGKRGLLSDWYRRDDNAVPPVYDLQPRTGRYVENSNWGPVERRLRSILIEAVGQFDLPEEKTIKYRTSATEQEILRGLMEEEGARDHVFCFFRRINGLPQSIVARDFIDLDEKGTPDREAILRLQGLKNRLEKRLPANTFHYETRWDKKGPLYNHIDQLCADVLTNLSRVIEEEITRISERDLFHEENAAHEAFGTERIRFFTGRADILEDISEYVRRPSKHPYLIHGISGSGKTALMAKAVERIRQGHSSSPVLYRFIGATPGSSEGRSLLEDLYRQIYRIFHFEKAKQRELDAIKDDEESSREKRREITQKYDIPFGFQKLASTFRAFLFSDSVGQNAHTFPRCTGSAFEYRPGALSILGANRFALQCKIGTLDFNWAGRLRFFITPKQNSGRQPERTYVDA